MFFAKNSCEFAQILLCVSCNSCNSNSRKISKICQTLKSTTQSVINWSFGRQFYAIFWFCLGFRSISVLLGKNNSFVLVLYFKKSEMLLTVHTIWTLYIVQRFSFVLKAIISKNRRTRTTQRGHGVRCPLLTSLELSSSSTVKRTTMTVREKKKKVTSLFLRLFLNQAVFSRQMISAAKVPIDDVFCEEVLIWKLRIWGN